MVEENKVEGAEFKWGKKRGVGGKKKDVQFYESFALDGTEYSLYDSVYLYTESDTEPCIGKLVKMWEHSDKAKKVKVVWFFRPCEVSNYLGAEEVPENELFLASGEGVGLANVNPLEAITGKCNVVCTSKDSRNPQPSSDNLHMADFTFSRTFDVKHCKIMDVIGETIAGVEGKFFLNRADSNTSCGVLKHDPEKKLLSGNTVATDNQEIVLKTNASEECESVEKYSSCIGGLVKENADSTQGNATSNKTNSKPILKKDLDLGVPLVKQNSSVGNKLDPKVDAQLGDVGKTNDWQENTSVEIASSRSEAMDLPDTEVSWINQNSSLRQNIASDPDGVVGKTAMNIKKEYPSPNKIRSRSKDDSARIGSKFSKGLVNQVHGEKVKITKDSNELDGRPSKRAKVDNPVKVYDDKIKKKEQKSSCDPQCSDSTRSLGQAATLSDDKSIPKLAKNPNESENGQPKRPSEKLMKQANGKRPETSLRPSSNEGSKIDAQKWEKPEADKSKWFKRPPWDEQMRAAHDQGTLVLLQNLDPSYTSAEVELIIKKAFGESCTAKMIQRTVFSSYDSGQALAVFKTRELAELVLAKLDEGCLLLSNGRPLVGRRATPCFPGKQTTFYGHLVIDKLRLQMQREMKEAVSTSHSSQPNTIEYDMAMEWCLLQARSDRVRKKLHKQQRQEFRKLNVDNQHQPHRKQTR